MDHDIQRLAARGPGRSRAVAFGSIAWVVANTADATKDFAGQAANTLARLDQSLRDIGSSRKRMLSVQVLLADIGSRNAFDAVWQEWIGPDPAAWPQRSCFQVGLAPGLLIEIVAVAARE
jgi:enamine deaminase RidA (YjgF/YER057c/UK114 family)